MLHGDGEWSNFCIILTATLVASGAPDGVFSWYDFSQKHAIVNNCSRICRSFTFSCRICPFPFMPFFSAC